MPDARHLKWELKQNWMQGGQYSKGLIYLRPVSRLIKLGCPKRCILLAFHGRSNYKLFHGSLIECFHSRGQHLCKFIKTKESVCIRKEFNSQRIGLGHQHGGRFIVLGQEHGRRDVMWKHSIPWQNSRHFATPLLVSPRKEVWQTIAENATPFRSG